MNDLAQRVVYRYAKRNLALGLKAALLDLQEGRVEPALKALEEFWSFLEIGEEAAEIGYTLVMKAEWLYALGPRDKNHLKDIVHETKDLRRWLPTYRNQGPIPTRLVQRFETLVQEAIWLSGKVHEESDTFSHGDFTITPMPGVSKAKLGDCLEALDKAAEVIRRKFPELLYGKVYVAKTVANGVANYVPDTIQLSLRASKTVGDVYALCHEFGHRYELKFWKDKPAREAFWKLSLEPVYETLVFDRGTRAKLADEFLEIAEAKLAGKSQTQSKLLSQYLDVLLRKNGPKLRDLSQAFLKDASEINRKTMWEGFALPSSEDLKVVTDKVLREPIAVTPYGAKNWRENFAEAFAHYVLGMPLVPEVAAIMEKLS